MSMILKIFAPLSIVALLAAVPVGAQMSAEPEQPSAGQSMRHAGHDTEGAIKNTYEGTKTAYEDSKITAKVKYALHHRGLTRDADIDVHTTAGVVTLTGKVPSERIATRAEEVADNTEGVRRVDNRLQTMVGVH